MNKKYLIIILILLQILLFSCAKKSNEKILSTMENIASEYPDSTLQLLTKLKVKRLSEYQMAQADLAKIIANDKLEVEISDDSLIFNLIGILKQIGTNEEKAKILFYSGKVCQEKNDIDNALKYFIESKQFGTQTDNNALKALIMARIARCYYDEHKFDMAVENYQQSFYFANQTDNYSNQRIILMMIGNSFLCLNNKDSALHFYEEALKIAQEHKDENAQIEILTNLGTLYVYYSEYEKAFQLFEKILAGTGNQQNLLYAFIGTAQAYNALNNLDSATYYIDKTFELLENRNYKYRQQTYTAAYELLSSIEEKKGNFEKALRTKDKYVELVDSIYAELSKEKLAEITEKYYNEKLENDYYKLLIENRNVWIRSLILFLLLLIMSISLFLIDRRKNKTLKKFKEAKLNERLLMQEIDSEKEKSIKSIKKLISKRSKFFNYEVLNDAFPSEINIIENLNSKLSGTEIAMCFLFYLKFEKVEMMNLLNLTSEVFNSRKSDIRKKLGLKIRENIGIFIEKKLTRN